MSKLEDARSIQAKENISEGIGIVQERQKMINLADYYWKVVKEYESNP